MRHPRSRGGFGLAVLAFAMLAAACGSATVEHSAVVETVDAATADAFARDGDHVILDVRTPEEFDDGHIEGAVNIDFYEATFADEIATLPRDAAYVLYCRSGNRSGATIDLMRTLGFTDVHEVEGGILEWVDAGLPLAGS